MGYLDNKKIERRIIEWAQNKGTLIPHGELKEFERPDWLIPSANLAIEVSRLLPIGSEGTKFSPPQLSTFQEEVVAVAENVYRGFPSARPVDVLVFFQNDWTRKRDPKLMGRALAEFVHWNYPFDGQTVTLSRNTPEGFQVIRIACLEGGWHAGAINDAEAVTYEQLNARIASKNQLVPTYRERLHDGWQVWLLLATHVSVLWSVNVPSEVKTWHFNSNFDRLLLWSWEHGLLELKSSSNQPLVNRGRI